MVGKAAGVGFLLAFLAPIGTSQAPCFAMNDGPAFNDTIWMGGANASMAIRFRAPATDTVFGAEVFTGEATGSTSLSIWSHDEANNFHLARLGVGEFQMSRGNGWQGTCFDTPVAILAEQYYWLMWDFVDGSQASIARLNRPYGQTYRVSLNGGASWNGPFSHDNRHWKFRLLCANSAFPGSWRLEGTGCVGSNGLVPENAVTTVPTVGGTFAVQVAQAAANTRAFALLGVRTNTPVDLTDFGAPGCLLQCQIRASPGLSTNGAGTASLTLPIAPLPSLVLAEFCTQWVVVDFAANQLGLAFSQVASARVGS